MVAMYGYVNHEVTDMDISLVVMLVVENVHQLGVKLNRSIYYKK